MRTNVYVDGFNLYYRCLKGTPYRWLDPLELCHVMLPQNRITRIRYFTAHVIPPPWDPAQLQRQETYIRALQTIPCLSVHYGQFRTHVVHLPLANPQPDDPNAAKIWAAYTAGGPSQAWVLKTEEKGSDVNLATHLLCDGFAGEYDAAVIISNDSDLEAPIRAVRSQLGLAVGVLLPKTKPSIQLRKAAKFKGLIDENALKSSQFPLLLTDANGPIAKPPTW